MYRDRQPWCERMISCRCSCSCSRRGLSPRVTDSGLEQPGHSVVLGMDRWICACVHVCMYLCMNVCMCICIHASQPSQPNAYYSSTVRVSNSSVLVLVWAGFGDAARRGPPATIN
ncbi:hypothetical protein EJ05DRAFT_241031 [Pseudovirgaria hyperparasitica]|uniref:Uncharacterized protein n=1 Tax=Pseudovirgaria hyperparasitica TaxID=470096 RepID=A0A6A6WD21_9PEZI|nr:uncharacterized protein EJ05DRAFT_241031 [Pseudovirgaria hyperparasitica]KAF2760732.1 hypothetical protein EJ05DRAFT_241031 [Pseudovirgaria hyperparasitica]